jgi:drug/metabolite transporter (DMT)-like permease
MVAMKKESLGILCMTASIGLFSLNDSLFKIISLAISPGQTVLWRSLISLFLLLIYYFFSKERSFKEIQPSVLKIHLIRSLVAFISLLLMGYALMGLQVTSFKSIYYLNPVFTVLFLTVFSKETLSLPILKILGLSCLGALFLMKPGSEILSIHGLFALAATVLYSLSVVIASKLKDQPPFEGVFFYVLVSIVGCFLYEKGHLSGVSVPDVLYISLMSLNHLFAFYLFLKALQNNRLQVLNPIEYTGLVWSSLFASILLSESPDLSIFIGALIIIIAQLLFRNPFKK